MYKEWPAHLQPHHTTSLCTPVHAYNLFYYDAAWLFGKHQVRVIQRMGELSEVIRGFT